MQTVLITGGSGLVGTQLSRHLLEKGYQVTHLSRSGKDKNKIKTYAWTVHKGFIDPKAIETADYIVHLAGANIAEKRWTGSRKETLVGSRVETANLLHKYLQKTPHKVKAFIGTSGVNYYPNSGEKWLTETDAPGNDFLSNICKVWERSQWQIQDLGIRTAILRIGIVLSKKGGALPKTAMSLKFGVGTYFGTGEQYYSWIYIDDLCRLIIKTIEDASMKGAYNAVAPHPVTNKAFVRAIGQAMGKNPLLIPAPEFALRLTLGELADTILSDVRVSADKILATGFEFEYEEVLGALRGVYG